MSIRMLIADDHEVVRTGMSCLLDGTEIEIVGQAATGAEAVEKAKTLKPDVISLDVRMPDVDGLTPSELSRVRPQYGSRKNALFPTGNRFAPNSFAEA